jgi:cytochrome c biogenesis protein CcmG/thiol:disulfide interchange protein DsbE
MRPRLLFFVPLIVLAIVLGVFAARLFVQRPDGEIHSALIGQPLPEFSLAPGAAGRPGLASADLRNGRAHLVNVFASWCVPCRIEAPQLAALARRGVPIVGIAVRDRPEDLAGFLASNGDPFQAIGMDSDRRVQIELGSAGVPETFVVDGRGIIRHQHIGAITDGDVAAIHAAWEAAR